MQTLPPPPRRGARVRLVLGALGLLTAAVTGVGLALPDPVAEVAAGPSARPAARAAASGPVCAGVAACREVARVDVDGDARADTVAVATAGLDRSAAPGSVTVRVRTAAGELLEATSRDVWWFGRPSDVWAGATAVDDQAGAELVVGQAMGAHSRQFRILTHRGGRLVTLPAPAPLPETGLPAGTATWSVDGGFAFQLGVTRTAARGQVAVTVTSLERGDDDAHRGWRVTYRRSDGTWVPVQTSRLRLDDDRAAEAVGGWHLPGLPRFGRGT